jgi:hypothetical protein
MIHADACDVNNNDFRQSLRLDARFAAGENHTNIPETGLPRINAVTLLLRFTVGEVGAVAVPFSWIVDSVAGRPASKVLSRAELQDRARQWREAGQRIVFTNGCF